MWIELVIILAIYAPYYLFIKRIASDWIQDSSSVSSAEAPSGVSIIIPFRNEVAKISVLISILKEQVSSDSEVILVDDNSYDGSEKAVAKEIAGFPNFQLVFSSKEGKKAALSQGIRQAKSEWIITLDADVLPSDGWYEAVKHKLHPKAAMVILPVTLMGDKTLVQKFDVFDFLALQGFTFSQSLANEPFLANGAHLAFKKEAWQSVGGYQLNAELASGDDVFLLEAFRKKGKPIKRAWSPKLLVETEVNSNLLKLVNQRIRWGSKTSQIDSVEARKFSIIIAVANVLLVVLALFGSLSMAFLGLLAKYVADYSFIVPVLKRYQRKDLIKFLPFFALYYPFYITFVGIATLVIKPIWKGRRVK